jgi:selenocysteine lyase/cysteine desulfurase
MNWDAVRAEFPALREWTYFNTASYGQMPRRAVEAAERHFARRTEFACADFLEWFDDADRIRGSIGRLINAEATDIAFFPNASTPLSLMLNGIEWRRGDRVVTVEHEFPNHLYWAAMLAEKGVAIAEYPAAEVEVPPGTRLVTLSTASYVTGARPDVERIAADCRRAGALLCVDGTQSLGAIPFDCRAVRPDMFLVDGYKWLLSPNGAGFAYVPPATRQWLQPSVIGWRSDRRWREVNALHHGRPEFADAAEKYEGAMIPFPCIYAMGAVVEWMLELGPGNIEGRVMELASRTAAMLGLAGADSHILTAQFAGRDAAGLVRQLKQRGILAAARHGRLRISTHFYNNEDDIARLGEALKAIL